MPTTARAARDRFAASLPLIAATLIAASVASAAPPQGLRLRPLELYWHDPTAALPFPHRLVGSQVVEALQSLGVKVSWQAAAPDTVTRGRELRVVLLGRDRSPTTRVRGVVGAVHCDPGSRTIWVLLPNLRRALGMGAPRVSPGPREVALLSHAVARVVVHEVFHLVVPDHPHTPGSLMQAHYHHEDLLAPVRLEPGLGAAFVAALSLGSSRARLASGLQPAGSPVPTVARLE